MNGVTAAALGAPLPREIDDDGTHHARGVREEMAALAAGELPGALEAQEALVQQHRGVEQRVAAAVAQLRARLSTQILVRDGEQPLARGFVARMRALDQQRQFIT